MRFDDTAYGKQPQTGSFYGGVGVEPTEGHEQLSRLRFGNPFAAHPLIGNGDNLQSVPATFRAEHEQESRARYEPPELYTRQDKTIDDNRNTGAHQSLQPVGGRIRRGSTEYRLRGKKQKRYNPAKQYKDNRLPAGAKPVEKVSKKMTDPPPASGRNALLKNPWVVQKYSARSRWTRTRTNIPVRSPGRSL